VLDDARFRLDRFLRFLLYRRAQYCPTDDAVHEGRQELGRGGWRMTLRSSALLIGNFSWATGAYALVQGAAINIARSLSLRWPVMRNGSTACS
jgi:hypothetical protein